MVVGGGWWVVGGGSGSGFEELQHRASVGVVVPPYFSRPFVEWPELESGGFLATWSWHERRAIVQVTRRLARSDDAG
jgi:hypothetical protein